MLRSRLVFVCRREDSAQRARCLSPRVAHAFEDEDMRRSMVHLLSQCSMDDATSRRDDDDARAGVSDEPPDPMHLSKREGERALNMSGRFDRGILKKTEGTWYFW